MAYSIFLDDLQLPIMPERIQIKTPNKNTVLDLANDQNINVLKSAGLLEISFDMLIPNSKYPFASYDGQFKSDRYYIEKLEDLKNGKKPFQFICSRCTHNGKQLYSFDIKVSLESYTLNEAANDGYDITANVQLKQYKDYGTKIITPLENQNGQVVAVVASIRDSGSAPKYSQYTIQYGDTLWNIAKKCLGKGERYKEIYELNKDILTSPSMIYAGQVINIPSV